MSLGPFSPRRPDCPESVPGVWGDLFDTRGPLSGHFLDTPVSLRFEGPQRHPWDTVLQRKKRQENDTDTENYGGGKRLRIREYDF